MTNPGARGHSKWSAQAGAQVSILDALLDAAGAAWRAFYSKTANGIGVVTFQISREMFDRAAMIATERGIAVQDEITRSLEGGVVFVRAVASAFEVKHEDGFLLRLEVTPCT